MATEVTAGTDLASVLNSSGDYLLMPGTHTISGTLTTAADVTLKTAYGATLALASSAILRFDDNFVMQDSTVELGSGAVVQALAISGNTRVNAATIQRNRIASTGGTAGYVRVGQGFNDYHRGVVITGNYFDRAWVLVETGDDIEITRNRFVNAGSSIRPIQFWGSNILVAHNWVDDGGIFGISMLGKANTAADRRPCTGNLVYGNLVTGTSEEGISIDVVGNVAAECVIREYDTVASKPGAYVLNLTSGNWSAQSTYTGSKYHAVFISGALAGRYFLITTHSGAAITLTGMTAGEYASISGGDGVSIQLLAYQNVIANNTIIPKLIAGRDYTTGITLHGNGIDNDIVNNITLGYGDDEDIELFGIREYLLNGITATDSVTGNARRGMVCSNRIRNNIVLNGGIGAKYHDYGSNTTFMPAPESTYSDNQELTSAGFCGGSYPGYLQGWMLGADSPAISAGTTTWGTDHFGETWYSSIDVGAFRRDQGYRRGPGGGYSPARRRADVVSRCRGVPSRYPEGL